MSYSKNNITLNTKHFQALERKYDAQVNFYPAYNLQWMQIYVNCLWLEVSFNSVIIACLLLCLTHSINYSGQNPHWSKWKHSEVFDKCIIHHQFCYHYLLLIILTVRNMIIGTKIYTMILWIEIFVFLHSGDSLLFLFLPYNRNLTYELWNEVDLYF